MLKFINDILNNEKDKLINKGINHLIEKCTENMNIDNNFDSSASKRNDEKSISINIKF